MRNQSDSSKSLILHPNNEAMLPGLGPDSTVGGVSRGIQPGWPVLVLTSMMVIDPTQDRTQWKRLIMIGGIVIGGIMQLAAGKAASLLD